MQAFEFHKVAKMHIEACSIVAAPFPPGAALKDIEEFFERQTDGFKCVRMQLDVLSKIFTGTVFVEFETDPQARWVSHRSKPTFRQYCMSKARQS